MKAGLRRLQRRFAGLLSGLGGGAVSCRMLLISDEREYTSEQQFAPIWRHGALLRARLGLAVRWLPLDAAMRRPPDFFSRFDAVGLKLSFRRPREEVEAIAARLRALTTKLVYFDGDDDSGILWPGLLDVSDLYVKKHVFADPAAYAARFIGKSNLTTHVARTTGRSFADDIIPEAGGIDPGRLARLHLGWSIALDDRIAALA
ncbi:MAG: glycosyltransferase family 1 protein, partial [Sphingomonadales bacterium]